MIGDAPLPDPRPEAAALFGALILSVQHRDTLTGLAHAQTVLTANGLAIIETGA
jgi:hypothetical protein